MGIEHWRVTQVRTPDHPPYMLHGGLPAEMLTYDAQWVEGIDPDTGEKTHSFVGPVFEGTEIELELQATGPEAGLLGVVAQYERFVPSDDPAPEPVSVLVAGSCFPRPGTVERFVVGGIARESGPFRLIPSDPQWHARICITLSPVEADPPEADHGPET
jgi:hypothetical protein